MLVRYLASYIICHKVIYALKDKNSAVFSEPRFNYIRINAIYCENGKTCHLTSMALIVIFSNSSLVHVDIPEGKTGQQVLDAFQKKFELAGATKTGSWSVECDTYVSSQNSGYIDLA